MDELKKTNLFKAAKIQLLSAESIVHPSMVNLKTAAYSQAVSYF